MSLKSLLFKAIPESKIKNKIRCFFYNKLNSSFNIQFVNNYFIVTYDLFSIKFFKNPFHLLIEQNQYFKHYTPAQGDIVVDAGGFWGTFAIYISKIVGNTGKVIVLEPDETSLRILKKNIDINAIKNIEVIKKGLWSRATKLQFDNTGELGSSFIQENNSTNTNRDYIDVTTIDQLAQEQCLSKIDFIKMDIEGSEIEALKGAHNTLRTYRPKFAIASYHIVDGETTSKRVENILLEYGYNAVTEEDIETITYAEK